MSSAGTVTYSAGELPEPKRADLIRALEAARGGTTVISYVTSTRPNFQESMGLEVVPIFNRHLRLMPRDTKPKIDLFIHSDGGDSIVPWRLVNLIREYCSRLTLLVPHRAFSAATLLALGCDEVIMHPMGNLGPTDATVYHPFNPQDPRNPARLLGISVEDVTSYINFVKEDVGIRHEDELVQAFRILAHDVHPLALGNVKRFTSQSRSMGIKLLNRREQGAKIPEHDVTEIVDKLTSRLYYHGHPIGLAEAQKDLGLTFVKPATTAEADAMWALYESYASDMKLDEEFNPVLDAIGGKGVAVPAGPKIVKGQIVQPVPVSQTTRLAPMISTVVESVRRTDIREQEFEVTVTREWNGDMKSKTMTVGDAWRSEERAEKRAPVRAARKRRL